MPEHLKVLVVILVLASTVFAVTKRPACTIAVASKDFERRRNLWLALTLTAFLAHNFWIFLAVAAVLLHFAQRSEPNRLAMYFFVLFALPPVGAPVPTLGLVNHLINIDYVRLLALVVLFPAFLSLRGQPGIEPFGRSVADKLLAAYLVLGFLLMLPYSPFTAILRHGVFYAFIDVFLPYYVASRSLRAPRDLRDALAAYVVAAMVLSLILVFEHAKFWLLYPPLDNALGVYWGWNQFVERAGSLRAQGTVGHPIAAGYIVAVAVAFFVYLRKATPNRVVWTLGMALLIAGLIAPLSRGPWVGAAAMMLAIVATGRAPMMAFAKLGLLGLVALPLALATPAGNVIIDYLPFVGTVDAQNVVGRQRLAEVSLSLFLQNPAFGSPDYIETQELQVLRSPDGTIDLVNTYVVVALRSGLVGLSCFLGVFLAAGLGIYRAMRNLADRDDENYVLGQSLFAALVGILVIIGTVSPVLTIPTIYWSVAGLGVAYARMTARAEATPLERPARHGPGIASTAAARAGSPR